MQPGTQLGHYEIQSALGKGGMGEVWRARDSKLGREVAIKTLPEEFAKDEERLARFEREAKLLASLNHPNIATIHGLEEDNGTRFLVLELVEGDTLADRLKRGAIPVEESLKLALQIAEALEAAHEKGVIHRDLKPANIKVTPDGKIKVLDFGLAKAFAGDEAEANAANSPTLSMQATQQGVILGTAGYMSPEQARGRTVDTRTDVWAFGCVLFEMLTGHSTFVGDDVSLTLARVLERKPEFDALPANLHPRLREVLERCLEKQAKDRLAGVSDARVDIQKVLADPDGVIVQPLAEVAQVATQSKLPWIAVLVVVAVVAGVGAWTLKPAEPVSISRFDYELPEGISFVNTGRQVVAISPDGRQFVYRGTGGFYLRAMDGLEAQMIPGPDGAGLVDPVFSPDGQQIVYMDFTSGYGRLMKVSVTGGAPTVLTDPVGDNFGISWETNETILYGQPDGIWQVSENGSTPVQLISTEEGEQAFGPQLLPGGEWVLFTLASGTGPTARWDEADIVIESLSSGERRVLLTGGSDARYVATGHLVYALEDALFALPFDVDTLELSGGPVSILQGVRRSGSNTGAAYYSSSDSGTLVYVPLGEGLSAELTAVWVDRDGYAEPIATIPTGGYGRPRISSDGERLLIRADDNLWIYDIASGRRDAVTIDGSTGDYTAWSPDGSQVAYTSSRSGGNEAWLQSADGSGEAQQLTADSDGNVHVDSWSPNGDVLAVHQHSPSGIDILMIPQGDADRTPRPFLVSGQYNQDEAQFSPDGRFVAYLSTRTGENQVYVRPYPGPGAPQIVSVDGGEEPIWGANGELFYRHPETHALMSVAVSTEPTLTVDVPQRLFDGQAYVSRPGVGSSPRAWYDVSKDGQRFLMLQREDIATPGVVQPRINIVLNWSEELKERVPVP